jgi:hypothetical protein
MADDKKSAPPKSGFDKTLLAPFIAVGVLIFISALLSGQAIFSNNPNNPTKPIDPNNPKENYLSPYYWIKSDQITEGSTFINFKDIPVRNNPAGMVIGEQKKLQIGVVRTGPVAAFGIEWFRVEYPVAPSGWIESKYISTNITGVRLINIFPIIYGYFKYVGYTLAIILFIVFVTLQRKLFFESEILKKKIKLKQEAVREKPMSLEEQIDIKPDIQEIPGFQVEEIVPVKILEQQNRWQHIQELIKSYNTSDWRQAIIEADIILEEMLDGMGYAGVTIGDKLKNVERSDFITLDKAWSAHKIRNQIAHDGSNFKLSKELAEKTIKDFEEVFREFYYI